MSDYYDVLGVPKNSSDQDIKKAWVCIISEEFVYDAVVFSFVFLTSHLVTEVADKMFAAHLIELVVQGNVSSSSFWNVKLYVPAVYCKRRAFIVNKHT